MLDGCLLDYFGEEQNMYGRVRLLGFSLELLLAHLSPD